MHIVTKPRYPATDYGSQGMGMGYGQMDFSATSQYGVPVRDLPSFLEQQPLGSQSSPNSALLYYEVVTRVDFVCV